MNKVFFAALLLNCLNGFSQSIHNLKLKDIDGNTVELATLNGKKILIVSGSSSAPGADVQIAGLNELGRRYKDSGLVIIIFPSSDFNNESKPARELKSLYKSSNIIVAERTSAKGNSISAIYKWLTNKAGNGVADVPVNKDYQKFFIDRTGKLKGYFSEKVTPLDPFFIKIIQKN